MCRRLIYLVSFILMLGSVSQAEDIQWTDLGPDHLWSTPANWDLGRVPNLADDVRIDVPAAAAPNGPVIQDGIDAKANGIFNEAPGEPTLTMTGGSLEVADWIWWGDGADSFGIWTMSGGTVDVANEFELGWGGGAGTLIMTGGTINAGEAVIPTGSGAFGELFLNGGTYNVTKPGGLSVKENGLIDITEGTLVLEGDETAKINELIAAGRITAYDGRGQFELDYDDRNPGKTMLTAVGRVLIVEAGGDIAVANAIAEDGDTIEIAAGTYYLTSQIEIKSGVTYLGAGPGLTIIDGNDVTRAFVAWGDRSFNNGNENPNDSGPKGWVLEGMTIQNCVADTHDRFSFTSAAFNLKTNFATLDADASGGLNPDEADGEVGGIRLAGADLTEGTEDDDLHRFVHIDTDGSGEISEAELDAQILVQEDEFGDEDGDGGAIFIGNEAVGTIANCDFLNNHTPIPGDGDDGGAINITGLSVVTINGCWFEGNYACSPTGVSESDETGDADGDGSHIKVQGGSASAITPGTTLIANRCVFLNGNAEDDGGAIQSSAVGSIIRLDACWFEGNTAADDGTVLFIGNESSGELTVTNCVFANNISTADSDRMCQVRRNSKFINCTFVGNNQGDQDLIYNNANAADTDNDGVDDEMADTTQVINCIFANNVVGNGDDVLGSRNNDFTIAAMNCLFFGNTLQNGNAADNTQRPDVETGSVLTDPLLDANYVPGAGSEAIDGGVDPATVGVTLTTDYNGDARPQGAAYDIGAYEFGATSSLTEGLVAYYALENNTEDGSGNGLHGTIVGNLTYLEGPAGYGMAMEFDGESYVDCGTDASLDITGPISMSIWIRPGTDGNVETAPLCKADASAGWSWQLRYGWGSGGKPTIMGFQFNATGGSVWIFVNQDLAIGQWYHIAASHDGATVKCYLDGVETDSAPMTDFAGGPSTLLIGSDGWRSDWIGAIDDVRIYDRALSEAEVLELASK